MYYYHDAEDVKKLDEKQAKLANHLGKSTVAVIAMEECGELIQALSKLWRNDNVANFTKKTEAELFMDLVEEVSDVSACLENIKILYGISDDTIYEQRAKQLARSFERYNLK